MKKYIAPEIELIRFLQIDVLGSSVPGGVQSSPNYSIDDEGYIESYAPRPTRPTRPH